MDKLPGLDEFTERLEARDRARLQAVASAKRRRELLAGRWLLQALASHLHLPSVVFDGGEGGGVIVRGATGCIAGLSASVSHAGPWVAVAIGGEDLVGLDLEVLTDRDFIALAQVSFPADVPELEALSADERKIAFYRRWTQHEAAFKRGVRLGRHVSWLLSAEWMMSLTMSLRTGPVADPLVWDEGAQIFRTMNLEAIDRIPGDLW